MHVLMGSYKYVRSFTKRGLSVAALTSNAPASIKEGFEPV